MMTRNLFKLVFPTIFALILLAGEASGENSYRLPDRVQPSRESLQSLHDRMSHLGREDQEARQRIVRTIRLYRGARSKNERDYFRMEYTRASRHLKHPPDQFTRNIRSIIDMAWPGLPFEEQMRKTWLTESVLCSARVDAGHVPRSVETECAKRYLLAQLALFPDARIVALGGKAQQRLARAGVQFVPAWAAGRPGCNRPQAHESWRQAVAGLQT